MAFDLGELLKDVPKLDTDREQIEYIRLDLIDEDPNNFYQLSGVEELAANIELCGLQQPIRVRNSSEDPNRYTIVSGHRRRKAIELLAKDNPDRWGEVACIVETDVVSPALQQLRLIYANANTRTMTSAEISEQAVQVERLLYQLKEDGYDFPGRMRDHVAQAVGKSKSKLARLKVIRENLEDCWNPGYKSDELGESVAYALAQMPGHHQIAIYLYWMDKGIPLRQLYEGTVKNYAKHLEKLDKLHCSNFNERCRNQEGKRHKVLSISSWQTCSCVDKCCAVCSDLGRCKYACPELADQIKKVKEDAREQRKQEKLAKEAEERPIIQKIQQYWNRFGEARNAADVSVKSFFEACSRYYGSSEEEKVVKMECLEGTFTTTTSLPYGYSCYLDDIDKLVRVADLFGCSLDYLFCRTDVKEMAKPGGPVPESDTGTASTVEAAKVIPGMWYPPSVEPPVGKALVLIDHDNFVDDGRYMGCGCFECTALDEPCEIKLWALMPAEDDMKCEADAPTEGWLPLQWIHGQDNPHKELRALAKFDMKDGYPPVEVTANWNGQSWAFKDGTVITGQCISWFPLPPDDLPAKSTLNDGCKTGMSPTGHCGAAACCPEPADCCLNCDKDCNLRCGWVEE